MALMEAGDGLDGRAALLELQGRATLPPPDGVGPPAGRRAHPDHIGGSGLEFDCRVCGPPSLAHTTRLPPTAQPV
jgi:hypothetical protein